MIKFSSFLSPQVRFLPFHHNNHVLFVCCTKSPSERSWGERFPIMFSNSYKNRKPYIRKRSHASQFQGSGTSIRMLASRHIKVIKVNSVLRFVRIGGFHWNQSTNI